VGDQGPNPSSLAPKPKCCIILPLINYPVDPLCSLWIDSIYFLILSLKIWDLMQSLCFAKYKHWFELIISIERKQRSLLFFQCKWLDKVTSEDVCQFGVVVHDCNPSYSGIRGRKITNSRPTQTKLVRTCLRKRGRGTLIPAMQEAVGLRGPP
jgi:hypothetical protein